MAYGYEQTNIASKRFEINSLNQFELEKTIHDFIGMYDEIVKHMPLGTSYDDVVYSVLFSEDDAYVNADEAIKSIKEVIGKEVRIPSGVKQRLVLMTAGKERTQKFNKLSSPLTKKTDWIGKAREDAITGLSGERLILQYEQERLRELGLYDQVDKIKHLSIVSDGFGYDIKSYDVDANGNVHDLFIEVKTTTLGYDSEFFVSKNELDKSRKLNDKYAVYRIYNCNDINPKFYVAKGSIVNNFFLDPITYSAKYRYLLQ